MFSIFSELLIASFRSPSDRDSSQELWRRSSFRIPNKSGTAFRIFAGLIKRIILSEKRELASSNFKILAFDSKSSNEGFRLNFLKDQKLKAAYISREQLHSVRPRWKRLSTMLGTTILILLLRLIFFLLKRNFSPKSLALLVHEREEWKALSQVCQDQAYSEVHFFSPYEIDANFLAEILMAQGVEVIKYPSPGPLSGHNSLVVADALAISNAYQEEEINTGQITLKVKKTFPSKPENWEKFVVHKVGAQVVPKYRVAYYSSATYLREQNYSTTAYIGSEQSEIQLLKSIALFLSKQGSTLAIYLHPKEKKADSVVVENYYRELLGKGFDYDLVFEDTVLSFADVDVAVGTYSTVLFDRVYCGFKTLFYTSGIVDFPLPSSALKMLCISDINLLHESLVHQLDCPKEEIFTEDLNRYPWYGWT